MLLNAAKCQAFNVPELLRENQRGGGVELPPPPTQIRVNKRLRHRCFPVNTGKFFNNTYFEGCLQTVASDTNFQYSIYYITLIENYFDFFKDLLDKASSMYVLY